jgi:alpha-mannosidase
MIRHHGYRRQRLAQMSDLLRERIFTALHPVDRILVAGPVDRISWEEAQRLEYRPLEPGERFGPRWATWWFRVETRVPGEAGRARFLWEAGGEATLWMDGRPLHGFDAHHRDAPLPGPRFEVELGCYEPVELSRCEVGVLDPDAWRLYWDFETLRALEAEADQGLEPSWAGELGAELNRFCNERDPAILARLYERRNATTTHELAAVGHAHLDTAWLWPLAETKRKAVRTYTTQLRLIDEYPGYRFSCSSAQHYEWIEQGPPELWQRIRAAVAGGSFVPAGGTWVEPDCNIPSGESLVRQFLHGQRWFESRFGRRCTEFWNPDVFGYNGQLPQLMRGAGISRFLTQKLSWNRFTRPEFQTFTWQGIDGSEVLAHFPPADTYNAEASVPELRRSVRDYRDHDHSRTSLLVFGFGDGGGGPTAGMLETLRRARDLQSLPRTELRTPSEFFEALEAEPGPRPTVLGELYFEYHRGTYTSQARVKRGNRRCEQALHDAEFLSAAAGDYPRAELDRLWKLVLVNQFHDILPGSSIGLVYEDAHRDLAEVEAGAESLCAAAHPGGVVNTVGVARAEVTADPGGELRFVVAPPFASGAVAEPGDRVTLEGLTLENAHLRAELSADGSLVSLVARAGGREALEAPGNRLELYEDRPVAWDAWDIDPSHLETREDCPPASSWSVATASPLRAELAFERVVGESSRLRQVVRLDAGSRRLEFHTQVDWRESHRLLKVCFPLAVRAPRATYEMQFGYAERPTHYSTSRDAAQYEVPGHRFADLSEHGFGVAVLTDSKYGYSCYGGELRVSLLRAPKSPDPEADMATHEFAYALVPHTGGWREAGVVAEGIRFNAPLRWRPGASSLPSFASVDDPNLVLDTIKWAEDSDALVLRLYEAHGARGVGRVSLAAPVGEARRANLLEDPGEPLSTEGSTIVIPYGPHEIVTVLALANLHAPAG